MSRAWTAAALVCQQAGWPPGEQSVSPALPGALYSTQPASPRWCIARTMQPGGQPLRQLPPQDVRPDAWPVLHAGQPSRSAAARLRLLGSRPSAPALITVGSAGAHRQPLEERLKACSTAITTMQTLPTASMQSYNPCIHRMCRTWAAHVRVR